MLRDYRQEAVSLDAARVARRNNDKASASDRAAREFREKFTDCIDRAAATGAWCRGGGAGGAQQQHTARRAAGVLALSWKKVGALHPDLFAIPCSSIFYVGLELTELPSAAFQPHHAGVNALFLTRCAARGVARPHWSHACARVRRSNHLTALPESLGHLTSLSRFNAIRNQLTHLPDALCTLTRITELEIVSNRLARLPHGMGNLRLLTRLTLSSNRLTDEGVPESIAMLPLLSFNVSSNLLMRVPEFVCVPRVRACVRARRRPPDGRRNRMPTLRLLCLDNNRISDFSVISLTGLQTLSLCRNNVTDIKDSIQELVSLENLLLDWNCLRELPYSMRFLTSLSARAPPGCVTRPVCCAAVVCARARDFTPRGAAAECVATRG